jgi:uncharacterized membrane protein YagU involved in acid resistance
MSTQPRTGNPLKVVLIAGLVAGTLDIIAACLLFYIDTGKNPEIVLKYIASGVFGRQKAYNSGDIMNLWGLLFHYIIATGFAAVFVWLYLKVNFISKNVIISGLIYGLIVWLIMNRVVVPLSHVAQQPFKWSGALKSMLVLMLMVGLPIALVTKKLIKVKN